MRFLPFLIVYGTFPALAAGLWFGGWALLLTPLVAFLLVPLADAVTGHNLSNPTEDDERRGWRDVLFSLPLYFWVPLQLGVLGWGLSLAESRQGWEFVGMVLSVGLFTGGIGITIAHELIHRSKAFERGLGEILMHSVTYSHFCVEHVYGHHRNVATPLDPATSRLGESVYAFYPRVVWGSLKSAIELERGRCERAGIGWWSLRHRLTRYALVLAALYVGVGSVFGVWGLVFFAGQSVVAFSLLEVINYVEHYGLMRGEKAPGKFERVQPHHSWNANHRVSGYWLFNLQRHADHHAYASRPYHLLRAVTEGPQLPHGYPTMLLMALLPPVWRRVMDPRVEALRQQN